MYHLDGAMKGDRDGYPACPNEPTGTCLVGGRRPGPFIDERGTWETNPQGFCDPDDANPDRISTAVRWNQFLNRNKLRLDVDP